LCTKSKRNSSKIQAIARYYCDSRYGELSEEDKLAVSRARRVQRFLSQPFHVAEQFTGKGVFRYQRHYQRI
jgi:hypothetical protein